MKFAIAAAALAAGVQAWPSNVTYTTEVVTAYTTYCPAATTISHNGQTYTVTEATTLTITNCPCTISKPVYSTSAPAASTPVASSPAASYPVSSGSASAPVSYPNSTVATTAATTSKVAPTGGVTVTPSGTGSTPVPTAGAGKAAALSGAGLAGVLGLVAYVL